MKILIAAVCAVALLTSPAFAVNNPRATPAPHSAAYKSLTQDAEALVAKAAAEDENYAQLRKLFQQFAVSVYAPYCKTRGGIDHVESDFTDAYHAKVYCKGGAKAAIILEEPK